MVFLLTVVSWGQLNWHLNLPQSHLSLTTGHISHQVGHLTAPWKASPQSPLLIPLTHWLWHHIFQVVPLPHINHSSSLTFAVAPHFPGFHITCFNSGCDSSYPCQNHHQESPQLPLQLWAESPLPHYNLLSYLCSCGKNLWLFKSTPSLSPTVSSASPEVVSSISSVHKQLFQDSIGSTLCSSTSASSCLHYHHGSQDHPYLAEKAAHPHKAHHLQGQHHTLKVLCATVHTAMTQEQECCNEKSNGMC
jgi:hypothetical protein